MTAFLCQVKTLEILPIITNSILPLENRGDTSSMKTDEISKKFLGLNFFWDYWVSDLFGSPTLINENNFGFEITSFAV